MKQRILPVLVFLLVVIGLSQIYFMLDPGADVTLLVKAFVLFFAAIVARQCLPAMMQFVGVLQTVQQVREERVSTSDTPSCKKIDLS